MARFIGIDLAWSAANPTGLAALRRRGRGLVLTASTTARTDDEILDFVASADDEETCVLAIDGPIIAPNPPGTMRPCDRAVARDFGRFHAGPYPANREKCARPIALSAKLARRGFSADPAVPARSAGRRQLEVFPHPAQVVLFRRERIIKYKKGPVGARRAGLAELAAGIARHLPALTPPLLDSPALGELLGTDAGRLRGRALKSHEDRLDALLCAYVAGYFWHWGAERCRVYGDTRHGYILCPRLDREHGGPGDQRAR